jgi:hypothetical protein
MHIKIKNSKIDPFLPDAIKLLIYNQFSIAEFVPELLVKCK